MAALWWIWGHPRIRRALASRRLARAIGTSALRILMNRRSTALSLSDEAETPNCEELIRYELLYGNDVTPWFDMDGDRPSCLAGGVAEVPA